MTSKIRTLENGFSLLLLSPRVALLYRVLKRPGKGGRKDRIQCGYFGFSSEAEAQGFAQFLRSRYEGLRLVVREADRLEECAFEVKVWEFPDIIHIAQICAKKAA